MNISSGVICFSVIASIVFLTVFITGLVKKKAFNLIYAPISAAVAEIDLKTKE